MTSRSIAVAVCAAIGLFCVPMVAEEGKDKLIVHEWGTFTELQDEQGINLGGINVDDEPVPKFVHGFGPAVLDPALGPRRSKRIVRRHPQVAVRLETPVIYFYPPRNAKLPLKMDVQVDFHGGWFSEFYPRATFQAPGLDKFHLSPNATGQVVWKDLLVGTDGKVPDTKDPVWLTPRKTDGVTVTTADGESERYLFYRGVGNFNGPLRVTTNRMTQELTLFDEQPEANPDAEIRFAAAWLVSVRKDKGLAFRSLGTLTQQPPEVPMLRVSSKFADEEHSPGNLELLHQEMHAALVDDGLFPKEATAMLDTWRHAYFESSGLRVFYLLPHEWTDARMPLTLSQDADVSRVMVGRIELISREQRDLIEQIRRNPHADRTWLATIPKSDARQKFLRGQSDFGDLGVEIPEHYQRYLDLGRFRNAMLRQEQQLRPTPELNHFMNVYRLQSELVPDDSVPTKQ